jgi:hypothetical protein
VEHSKTPAERREEQRRQKLDDVQEQVDSGSLVIRRMTKAERKRNPPKPRPPKRKR